MKHQINLYHEEFQPRFEVYTGAHLVGLSVVSIFMVAIAYGVFSYLLSSKELQYDFKQNQLASLEKEISQVTLELTQRTGSPALERKLANYTQNLKQQQILVNKIKSISGLKNKSFSNMFDAFSDTHNNKLWLTSFSIVEDKLTIKGQLSNPTALPEWISQLSETRFFEGQQFADAVVQRDDDVLVFRLTSQSAPNGGNSESEAAQLARGNTDGGH